MGVSQKGLSPALEGKFKLAGMAQAGEFNSQIGLVDFRTISLEKAERLVRDFDCPYLKPITAKSNTKKPEKS